MVSLDYAGIASSLLAQARSLVPQWLPGGKTVGKYYNCASIQGGKGDSFKVNYENGTWGEFNGMGQKGGDLIALYAAINGLSQHDAAVKLGGLSDMSAQIIVPAKPVSVQKTKPSTLVIPLASQKPPVFMLSNQEPTSTWCYKTAQGEPIFHIARYDKADGKKVILPFSFDGERKVWVNKHYPEPRPLYGLDLLAKRTRDGVLVVEGEKACEAARRLLGDIYVVVTWPGGCQAFHKVDWSPLHGRKILLWPDADEPGEFCMKRIADQLWPHSPEIKLLEPTKGPKQLVKGWDAADAWAEGMTQKQVVEWARQCVKIAINPNVVVEEVKAPVDDAVVVQPATEVLPPKAKTVTIATEDVTNQTPPTRSLVAKWLEVGIAQSGKGQPVYNEENVLRIFERDPFFKDFVWWDGFHKKMFTHWSKIGQNGVTNEWTDVQLIRLLTHLQREWGLSKINHSQVDRAVAVFANEHPHNEPQDWVRKQQWDGVNRLEHAFVDAFECDDNEYTRAVSKNFFISLIARLFEPGCQVDTMVVMEGRQGAFKSSALRVLGGHWYASARANIGSPNFYSNIQGKWIIEVAEMDSFRKAEVSQIKEMLTTPVDRFKIPYQKYSADFPRQCVFVGTTNEQEYLQDMTGARRFWPILCHHIHLDYLVKNRAQLFAEAYHRWQLWKEWRTSHPKDNPNEAPETWWNLPDALAKAEQDKRREHDPWEDDIAEFIRDKKDEGVQIRDIMKELAISKERQTKKEEMRIGRILRLMGWEKRTTRLDDNIVVKLWKPDSPQKTV